ncbi:type II secretion system protein [Thalassotalea euphylliae]|uniref:Type II secretion system protein n=1 Tax=Thalassotalea euphylliae TaxID=1655234 RepID=A0A3E0TQ70_9GAMM|nr:type II secretion system protein [Thalassotalea euphylliae]REL26105.1 type II secretion system protein [Thalassotalea euphylliae]
MSLSKPLKPLPSKTNVSQSGFTLIELIIVMSIVAIVTSLVGPLTFKSLDKIKQKEEQLSLNNWINGQLYRSFANQKQGVLAFEKDQVRFYLPPRNKQLYNNNLNAISAAIENIEPLATRQFEQLNFTKQFALVSVFGYMTPNEINVTIGGENSALFLGEKVDNVAKSSR